MQDGDKQQGQVIEPETSKAAIADAPNTPAPQPDSNQSLPATNDNKWQFRPETPEINTPPSLSQSDTTHNGDMAVTWTASEFIAHDKDAKWYASLGAVGSLLVAVVYLLTRDIISSGMIIIITVLFGVFAGRKPRVLNYELDQGGLHVAHKFYPYADFKSFAVMDEGGINAIWLTPLKRFMPSLTIYYAPNDEDDIVQVLGQFLPVEERDHDMVDRLMRKVRF